MLGDLLKKIEITFVVIDDYENINYSHLMLLSL